MIFSSEISLPFLKPVTSTLCIEVIKCEEWAVWRMITTAHHIRSNLQMFCIVLLYTAVSAERGVYEITDTDEIIAGLYVETEDPSTFQQLGGPDDEGYFLYLYSRPNNPTKWMLGDGKNKKRITNPYSAQAHMQKMHEPPQDGWTSTKTGRTQRFKVSRRSSLLSTFHWG